MDNDWTQQKMRTMRARDRSEESVDLSYYYYWVYDDELMSILQSMKLNCQCLPFVALLLGHRIQGPKRGMEISTCSLIFIDDSIVDC